MAISVQVAVSITGVVLTFSIMLMTAWEAYHRWVIRRTILDEESDELGNVQPNHSRNKSGP
ncbi:uncharacterized protein F4822DRAFT_434735 [Hypoxylon trugodes]|uniref:uncharacterized protein n=1 Tax=Hypoxylon trugodes TaxID=326681 RepID=UPI0021A230E6|nr:uncharacterized protein F4822DRAFT_434735 [Hypoxylon trugodes]KAI1383621.1 hypothetical protein F4822DRAFT_434735 [Hypoxylon trugodes]